MTRQETERGIATVLAFSAIVAGWIYLDFDTENGNLGDPWSFVLIPTFFVAGFVINRWWAFLLAFLPVFLSIPAGYVDGGESPVFVFMVFPIMPLGLLLIAAGLGARRLLDRRRTT